MAELRHADLISNKERDNLGFTVVHFLKEEPFNMKPLVLPICFFAGKIQQALDSASVDSSACGVLSEAVNLLLALLHKLNFIGDAEFNDLRRIENKETGSWIGVALLKQPQNQYHVKVCPALAWSHAENGCQWWQAVLYSCRFARL